MVNVASQCGFTNQYEDLQKVFQSYDRALLVNDTRRKAPKHPMGRGARKKRQKSYR